MSYIDICLEQLPIDEGTRSKPYRDTVGKLTIGVGRNLDDVGLRPDEMELMLRNDIAQAEKDARAVCQSFNALSDARKAVLVNMAFNMGRTRLAGFAKMLAAINERDYEEAAQEMLDSKWAQQVGERAQRLAKAMREG